LIKHRELPEHFLEAMRNLTEFSALEWLTLLPAQHALKQARNDAWLAVYKRSRTPELDRFLKNHGDLTDKNIALVIAFEQPWALNWLLRMARKNLSDTAVIVFDNSRSNSKRMEIEEVCKQNQAPYLALPPNPTKHVNRSHGMAMTWVYYNVVRAINPRMFGFIDHDLIPVHKVSMAEKMKHQPVYGLLNVGKLDFWFLWAGYCFFDYEITKGKSINFLYDFSRDLDTGGRNWNSLYRHLDRRRLRSAKSENVSMTVDQVNDSRLVQFVDESWLHIGGISYSYNSPESIEFFRGLEEKFNSESG
jgi:hypothetical protein